MPASSTLDLTQKQSGLLKNITSILGEKGQHSPIATPLMIIKL
jgi:hypothetical protein